MYDGPIGHREPHIHWVGILTFIRFILTTTVKSSQKVSYQLPIQKGATVYITTKPKNERKLHIFQTYLGLEYAPIYNQLEQLVCKPMQTPCDAPGKVCQVALVTKSSSTPLTRTGSLLGLCSQLIHHNQSNKHGHCQSNLNLVGTTLLVILAIASTMINDI